MSVIALEPDDVLMGVGRYRDRIDVVCPECQTVTVVERGVERTDCDDCGESLEIETPFG